MASRVHRAQPKRRAFAAVLALALLAILTTLAASFAATTNMGMLKSKNIRAATESRLVAEGGISFYAYTLRGVRLTPSCEGAEMMEEIADALAVMLDGTGNLNGVLTSFSAATNTITIPEISLGEQDGSFSATLQLDGDDANTVWLAVTGRRNDTQRTIRLGFTRTQGDRASFDYGIATRGQVVISGQGKVLSANGIPEEASVLSTWSAGGDAFDLAGQARVEGDVYASSDDATVSLSGQVSIGGASGEDAWDHVHIGGGHVEFPEPDPSIFEPYATTDFSESSPPKGTYTNIRILRNTNPTFASKTTLEGVIFVEAPNRVHFSGKATIRGVIATEDARDVAGTSSITFSGQVTSEALGSLAEEVQGVFILAPGFETEFSGQFGTLNGTMAADSFKFSGQAGGIVKGAVIAYSDEQFKYSGQAGLTIDRGGDNSLPPSFVSAGSLQPVATTYRED